MKMKWKMFKEIVKELRIKQDRLMRKQNGLDEVLVAISIFRKSDYSRMFIYPHSVNLTTGDALGFQYTGESSDEMIWTKTNIKRWLEQ